MNYLIPLKNLIIKILLISFLFSVSALSQSADTIKADTSLSDSGFVMQKSPMGAMLRSAVLPGFGQFYNESYWKIPVIWGVSAWFLYLWNDRNDLYVYYKDQYNISLNETSNSSSSFYKARRDFYRDDRDLFAIYLGLTYFLNLIDGLNIIDAVVDAHLFDFDININQYTHRPELNIRFNL